MQENSPFNIVNKGAVAAPHIEESTDESPTKRIESMINASPIFIFMKGTPNQPQCGFSANTVAIFNSLGKSFQTFDVLSAPEIRSEIKNFSNWPTIPQIYIGGKFIGGNDIITELHQNGELTELTKGI